MKDPQTFWNKTAPRYAKSPIRNEAAYKKKLAITRGYLRPDSEVLEFGCGTGSTAIMHAPHVKHILATDVSGKMLEIAEAKARDAGVDNISFQQGRFESIDAAEGRYDAVLGLNILHLLEDVDATITKVNRLLKSGGVFVSSTALLKDVKIYWRLAIPLMQLLNLAPYVNSFSKEELLSMLSDDGFVVDHEWQPEKESVFIVAKKP